MKVEYRRREGRGVAEVDRSEKITINIGLVDLGQIDLLVDEGFYANRTDFIRTAIRRQVETRSGPLEETVVRRALTLATIASVEVLGAFRAPRAVKAALASRTV